MTAASAPGEHRMTRTLRSGVIADHGGSYSTLTIHGPWHDAHTRPWGDLLAAAGADLGALEESGVVADVLHMGMMESGGERYIHIGYLRLPPDDEGEPVTDEEDAE